MLCEVLKCTTITTTTPKKFKRVHHCFTGCMNSRKRVKRGGDGGSYYSHLRRRVVRQPTDVLYDMISKYVHQVHDKKLAHDICERCTAYPDDVNFLYNYNPRTPLSCLLQERRNRDKVSHNMFFQLIVSTIINSDSFRVFDEVRLNNRNKCFLKYFSKENRQR